MPVVGKNGQKKITVPVLAAKTRRFLPGGSFFTLCFSCLGGTAGAKIKKIMPSLVPSLVPVACGRESNGNGNCNGKKGTENLLLFGFFLLFPLGKSDIYSL